MGHACAEPTADGLGAFVSAVVVTPKRAGLGRVLMRGVEADLVDRGTAFACLYCAPGWLSERYYAPMGYSICSPVELSGGREVGTFAHSVWMRKDLGDSRVNS